MSVQAHLPQLKPAKCNIMEERNCAKAKGFESAIFFMALYLVALGSGCVKPNMIAHGADQFDVGSVENDGVIVNVESNKKLSRYFNLAYFAFSAGQLVALTVLVWVQTHSGMDVGFGVSAAVMAMALISLVFGTLLYRNKRPQGTMVLTSFAQVRNSFFFFLIYSNLEQYTNLIYFFLGSSGCNSKEKASISR